VIVGLGLGVVETSRFRSADLRYGARFRRRIFTQGEQAYAAAKRRGYESLAARFAAKLATARALGLTPVPWHELEVVRGRGRAPELALHRGADREARAQGVTRASLSVTHDERWCIAHVILEGGR
jgi:holo-[acyl-carrier protein] synthase